MGKYLGALMQDPVQAIGSTRCRIIVAAGTSILAFSLFMDWSHRRQMRSDLHGYGRTVRGASCPIEEKLRLLDQIDNIEDLLGGGNYPPHRRWRRFDQVVNDLMTPRITPDDLVLLEREFSRLEDDLSGDPAAREGTSFP
jgi:hypothetical protein